MAWALMTREQALPLIKILGSILVPDCWGFRWQEWWTLCWTWVWTTKRSKHWQRCLATGALPLTAIGALSRCIRMLSSALNTTTSKSTWSVQRQSVAWSRSMAFWCILMHFDAFCHVLVYSCTVFVYFWWRFWWLFQQFDLINDDNYI